jgi:broad-specificity NMP kinase
MELKQYRIELMNKDKNQKINYDLIMLIGLPCSGKTTFSNNILDNFGSSVLHLNQDEIGKKACYELLNCNKTIILDRCNLTIDERKKFIDINKRILCIFFK